MTDETSNETAEYWLRVAGNYRWERDEWIAYADKLERVLELVCGASKDQLIKTHAEHGLRIVRPDGQQVGK